MRRCRTPGSLADLATKQYRGSGLALTVTFSSDASEGGAGLAFEFGCGGAPALPQSCGEEMAALAEPMQAVCCSPPATCAADGAPPTACSADCAGIFRARRPPGGVVLTRRRPFPQRKAVTMAGFCRRVLRACCGCSCAVLFYNRCWSYVRDNSPAFAPFGDKCREQQLGLR